MPVTSSVSLAPLRTSTNPRLRMLCFPFAGGSASSYMSWRALIPSEIELWGVELPGHGSRALETPLTRIGEVIEQLVPAIAMMNHLPLVFYGHSMGATLAFHCVREMHRRSIKLPRHLIVSGRAAPHLDDAGVVDIEQDDPTLIEWLRQRGGTEQAVLDTPGLMAFILPLIRADLLLLKSHRPEAPAPLPLPLTALGGTGDSVPLEALKRWQQHTSMSFRVDMFHGGHFFIRQSEADVVNMIVEQCLQILAQDVISSAGAPGEANASASSTGLL